MYNLAYFQCMKNDYRNYYQRGRAPKCKDEVQKRKYQKDQKVIYLQEIQIRIKMKQETIPPLKFSVKREETYLRMKLVVLSRSQIK